MLVGSLHGTMINFREGAEAGIFSPTFAKEYVDLCAKQNIEEANKVLNVQDSCARVLVGVVLP